MYGWLSRPGTNWWRGQDGVRAGFRIVVFIIILFLITALTGLGTVLISAWAKQFGSSPLNTSSNVFGGSLDKVQAHPSFSAALQAAVHHIPPQPVLLLQAVSSVIALLITVAIMTRFEKRSLVSCYLEAKNQIGLVAIGLICGLAAFIVILGIVIITGHATLHAQHQPLGTDLYYGFTWIVIALISAFVSEFSLRGYVQQTLTAGMGFWGALVLTSLAPCLMTSLGMMMLTKSFSIVAFVSTFGLGVMLCVGLRQTGSLWWSIGFEAAWGFCQSFLFGSNVKILHTEVIMPGALFHTTLHGAPLLSGGDQGLQSGLACIIVELIVILLLLALRRPAILPTAKAASLNPN